MGTTTFSGPVKAGTVREGASVNTGFVLMSQSAVIDIIGATNTTTIGIVPANSQIVDAILNVTTVSNDGGTGVVQIGTAADPNAFMSDTNVKALGVTHTGGTTSAANDVGTSDVSVTATYTAGTGNGTTGVATVQVGHAGDTDEYLPATNVKALGTTRGTIGTDGTDIGSSDQTVNAVFTAGTGNGATGAATVTVLYMQNNNLA